MIERYVMLAASLGPRRILELGVWQGGARCCLTTCSPPGVLWRRVSGGLRRASVGADVSGAPRRFG